MTPYYDEDGITIYHGDCREIDAWLAADVLVTDPPYGIGWTRGAWDRSVSNTSHNAGIANDRDTTCRDAALAAWGRHRPALVFGSMKAPMPAGWRNVLVFGKPTTASGLFGQRGPWLANWEPVFVLGEWPDQTPSLSGIVQTSEKAASGYSGYVTRAGHSHAKPLDVMSRLIQSCPPGVIADPFIGSGTTLRAAKDLGRRAIGVEVDERYCEIAAKRLAQGVLDFGVPA